MERADELMLDIREEMRLSREAHADLREFIREQTLRMRAHREPDRAHADRREDGVGAA